MDKQECLYHRFLHDWVGQSFLIDIVNDRQECLSYGFIHKYGGKDGESTQNYEAAFAALDA
jgi:hypothetical protein